jgi:hypothetical protein
MAIEDRLRKTRLRKGEMPQPCYLRAADEASGDSKGIGISAYSLDGRIEDYLHWINVRVGSLDDEPARHFFASHVTRMKLYLGIDAAGGPAVNISSSQRTAGIALDNKPGKYGIYVEAGKRQLVDFKVASMGLSSEKEVKRKNPRDYRDIFLKALRVLPYDKKK